MLNILVTRNKLMLLSPLLLHYAFLTWDCMLKYTKSTLQILKYIELLLFIEYVIREEIFVVVKNLWRTKTNTLLIIIHQHPQNTFFTETIHKLNQLVRGSLTRALRGRPQ